MNEVTFDEKDLPNLQIIAEALFSEDASDPRSWFYKRQLVRPKIPWWRIVLFTALLLAGSFSLYFLLVLCAVPAGASLVICLAGVFITLLLSLKRILICLIQIYQRYAPSAVRNKCRFEPSCSQYMILSLQKYGVLKGFQKGRNRLKRCNTSDGGFDYP